MGNSAEINQQVYTQTTDEGLRRAVEEVGAGLSSTKNNEQLFTFFRMGELSRVCNLLL